MTISLSGATVPNSLKRIDLTINIAGRSQTLTFPPQPSLNYDFSWDGVDVYGRRVQGARDAVVARHEREREQWRARNYKERHIGQHRRVLQRGGAGDEGENEEPHSIPTPV